MELILPRLVVKRPYGWGYEATERCVADSLGLRQCCRVYWEPVPDATPPLRWVHLIGAATLAAFDARVGALACSLKVTRGADRGYDSNAARALLVTRDIEPIIPARRHNRKATHQDGRKLRRYRHRWIIERTNAWPQSFRRLVVRYEWSAIVFTGLVHLVCALSTLKKGLG